MDNIITGLFAVAVFLSFVIGLAISINALPFSIIVGVVCLLFIIDFIQSARDGLKGNSDE